MADFVLTRFQRRAFNVRSSLVPSRLPHPPCPAMPSFSLALHGFFQAIPAHILIDGSLPFSKISSRFAGFHRVLQAVDLTPTVPPVHALSCRGVVSLPTEGGSYRSHMILFFETFGNFDIILGADWVSACFPSAHGGTLKRPPLSVVAALAAAHMWKADGMFLYISQSNLFLTSRLYVVPSLAHTSAPHSPCIDHSGHAQPSAVQVDFLAAQVGYLSVPAYCSPSPSSSASSVPSSSPSSTPSSAHLSSSQSNASFMNVNVSAAHVHPFVVGDGRRHCHLTTFSSINNNQAHAPASSNDLVGSTVHRFVPGHHAQLHGPRVIPAPSSRSPSPAFVVASSSSSAPKTSQNSQSSGLLTFFKLFETINVCYCS